MESALGAAIHGVVVADFEVPSGDSTASQSGLPEADAFPDSCNA